MGYNTIEMGNEHPKRRWKEKEDEYADDDEIEEDAQYETEDEQQALPDYLQPHPPPPPINTLSAAQCAANLRDPTHIFRRMWAGAVGAHRL